MSKKTFYWLKLQDNFFDREEIKIIEGMPNGKDYIIFYMKMLLKSVSSEGALKFRNTIPYSPEMLSTLTHTNVDTVRNAVELFIGLNLMDRFDDGTLFMIETKNMLGSESKWAEYKRAERASKHEEIGHCPKVSKNSPIEIEKELEIDIYTPFSKKFPFITKDSFDKLVSHLETKYETVTKVRLTKQISKLKDNGDLFSYAVDQMIENDYNGLFVPSQPRQANNSLPKKFVSFAEQKLLNQEIRVETYPNGRYLDANGEIRDADGWIA